MIALLHLSLSLFLFLHPLPSHRPASLRLLLRFLFRLLILFRPSLESSLASRRTIYGPDREWKDTRNLDILKQKQTKKINNYKDD